MKIALLQMNLTVGDLEGNISKIVEGVNNAAKSGAELCVTSELAITGYPPRDLLLNADFVNRCRDAVIELSHVIPKGVALLVGGVDYNHEGIGNPLRNAAWFIVNGSEPKVFYKWLLPTYDVFDEQRYFEPTEQVNFSTSRAYVSESPYAKMSGMTATPTPISVTAATLSPILSMKILTC